MNILPKLFHNHRNITLLKYFLSYFLILSILFTGFFLAVRIQLGVIYSKELYSQAEQRLSNVTTNLSNDLVSINQIQNVLSKDINLILSRSRNKDWYLYQAAEKLNEFTIGNNLIDSICYIDFRNGQLLSSGNHIKMNENNIEIYKNQQYLSFPLQDYMEITIRNQLIFLEEGNTKMLIYLPYNNGNTTYSLFYILNLQEINNILAGGISSEVLSVGLLDENNRITEGVAPDILTPYLSQLTGQEGFYPKHENSTLYAITGISGNYSIVALLSNNTIMEHVNIAFRNTYLLLLLLAAVGLLLIVAAMTVTYWPLHRLIQKLIPSFEPQENYVVQLDTAFTNIHSENQQLQKKIESYRLSMQKSLLDSIVSAPSLTGPEKGVNIDQLFNMDPDSRIYLVKLSSPKKKPFFLEPVLKMLNESLPGGSACTILENMREYAVCLIFYSGTDCHKDDVLHMLLTELHTSYGYFAAMSEGAASPLELPALYENMTAACSFWPNLSVVSYAQIKEQSAGTNDFAYPYPLLECLSSCLQNHDFAAAKDRLLELSILLDKASSAETPFPDFFTRCILIDILTILANSMNHLNVKFKIYSDLYFSTLYLCRSCNYPEKKEEIHLSILQLLSTYETEYSNSAIHTSQIKELVHANYTSPDFSISTLADSFHVSIAYMSYLFKKKFHENFSDYLWNLRMEVAKDLLQNSDLNINDISIRIGYINTSSFRRKFKQETGLTPSQFRSTELHS